MLILNSRIFCPAITVFTLFAYRHQFIPSLYFHVDIFIQFSSLICVQCCFWSYLGNISPQGSNKVHLTLTLNFNLPLYCVSTSFYQQMSLYLSMLRQRTIYSFYFPTIQCAVMISEGSFYTQHAQNPQL